MSTKAFSLAIADGIARLGFDLPDEPVNKITTEAGSELQVFLDQIADDNSVKAVVFISDKENTFIAGADIDKFATLKTEAEARVLVESGQLLVDRLAGLGKPVVAAIHGTCVGGGTEISLACSYRIATNHPKTSIGLPEVQLGIIPGMGGCQRLPRLIGLRAALDIILAGKVVPAKRAARLGMVDELVHPAVLEFAATAAAKKLAGGWTPKRKKSKGLVGAFLDKTFLGRWLVYSTASKQVAKKTGGNFPAPPAAIDAIRHGLSRGIRAGLEREAEHFARLAVGDVSRELVKIFFATTALKKDSGVVGDAPEPINVGSLGVVGAGFMGAGIAGTAVYKANVDVRFRDTEFERIQSGVVSVRKMLRSRLKRWHITKFEHRRLDALISGGTAWDGFGNTDLVIEAVFEDLEIKRQVFRDLEAVTRPDCILASNTSTIPIRNIAEVVENPERVVGMHFFSPVEKMPLLEVIVTESTAPWVVTSAVAFGRQMGKTVIVVGDSPGFWVNRILSPYLGEATRLVTEGVTVEEIDRVMKRYGFPVGPITLLDEVGLDVAVKASGVMQKAFGERLANVPSFVELVDAGHLGRKNGKGFYRYEKGKRQGVDRSVYKILNVDPVPVPDKHIERRLILSMLNEAAMAVDEGVVRSARDGDIGAIFGIGFPPFRGGPLRELDRIGIKQVVEHLKQLRDAYGERFQPAPLLEKMATGNDRFYPDE